MPVKWYVRAWLRFRARLFCPFGVHFGTWENAEGSVWCPNCQRVVGKSKRERSRFAFRKEGETDFDEASPVLYWWSVPDGPCEDGWRLLECQPTHPRRPVLRVVREKEYVDGPEYAIATCTCSEPDGDEEETVFEVWIPYRDDLGNCSVCGGAGRTVSGGDEEVECPWCGGLGRTPMDEGKEIACALYWSWLRSPNGGAIS